MLILKLAIVFWLGLGGMAVAQGHDDIQARKSCRYCGMDRGAFSFSRMWIEYDDGSKVAVCSLHCAALDLANNIDKTPLSIRVGEFIGRHLIDGEKAFWVIGGNRPGVMSKKGKWAFERKQDAEEFIKFNQGSLSSFDEAMKAAYEGMFEDTKMIREKRKVARMKKAEQKPAPGN